MSPEAEGDPTYFVVANDEELWPLERANLLTTVPREVGNFGIAPLNTILYTP